MDGGAYRADDGVGRVWRGVLCFVNLVALTCRAVTCPFPHGGEFSVAAGNLAESRCQLDRPAFKRDCFQSGSAYRLWRGKDWLALVEAYGRTLTMILIDEDGRHFFGNRFIFRLMERLKDERHGLKRAMYFYTSVDALKGRRSHDR